MQGVPEGLRRRELQGKGIVPWRTPRQQPRQGERTEKIKYTIQNSYRIHYNLKGLLRGNSCHKGENLYII